MRNFPEYEMCFRRELVRSGRYLARHFHSLADDQNSADDLRFPLGHSAQAQAGRCSEDGTHRPAVPRDIHCDSPLDYWRARLLAGADDFAFSVQRNAAPVAALPRVHVAHRQVAPQTPGGAQTRTPRVY